MYIIIIVTYQYVYPIYKISYGLEILKHQLFVPQYAPLP